jgi:hypothetical protein
MFSPQVGFAVSLALVLGLVVWFMLKIRTRWLRMTSITCLFAVPAFVTLICGSFLYGTRIGYLSEILRQSSVDANSNVRALTLIEAFHGGSEVDPWLEGNVKHNLENKLDVYLTVQEDFIKNPDQLEWRFVRELYDYPQGTNDAAFQRDMPEVTAYRRTHPGKGYHTNYNDILTMY